MTDIYLTICLSTHNGDDTPQNQDHVIVIVSNCFIYCKYNIIRNYFTQIPQEIAYSDFLRGRLTSLNENQLLVCMYVCYFKHSFSILTDQGRDTCRAEQARIFCSCVLVSQVLLYALFLDKPTVVCRRMAQRLYRKLDKGIYFKTVSCTRTPCFNLPSQCLIDRVYISLVSQNLQPSRTVIQ